MIILDTNILSEMMRPQPNQQVIQWLNQQPSTELFISSISIAEIEYGLYIMPQGKRKQQLQVRFNQFIERAFQYRVVNFDDKAAKIYGKVMGEGRRNGHPMSVPDGQIAAMALSHQAMIATRNTKDFDTCGAVLINPFID